MAFCPPFIPVPARRGSFRRMMSNARTSSRRARRRRTSVPPRTRSARSSPACRCAPLPQYRRVRTACVAHSPTPSTSSSDSERLSVCVGLVLLVHRVRQSVCSEPRDMSALALLSAARGLPNPSRHEVHVLTRHAQSWPSQERISFFPQGAIYSRDVL
jgi:hypothetical protein